MTTDQQVRLLMTLITKGDTAGDGGGEGGDERGYGSQVPSVGEVAERATGGAHVAYAPGSVSEPVNDIETAAVEILGLPRFGGRLRGVVTGTEVNDSRWESISLGDWSRGSLQRVVVAPRPTDLAGLKAGSVAAASVALGLPGGRRRAAFELVGAQVPQRGVRTPGVVQPHDTTPMVPGSRTTGRCTTHGTLGPGRRSESIGSFGTHRGQSPAVRR